MTSGITDEKNQQNKQHCDQNEWMSDKLVEIQYIKILMQHE